MRLKKRRGVFYTPTRLAEILVDWCVRSRDDVVLEPSFGGCDLISALQARLRELGNNRPSENIYGCDIDSAAFKRHLPRTFDVAADPGRFRKSDFLSLDANAFRADGFSVVVGNPPYVSYHNMFKTQRVAALSTRNDPDFRLSGLASLWAYFVFHSLKFLRRDGRMGWVLPGSSLHADYGKELLHELAHRFIRVGVISLNERVFKQAGVTESTEILVCDGFQPRSSSSGVKVLSANSVEDCAKFLVGWKGSAWKAVPLNGRAVPALTGHRPLAAYRHVSLRSDVATIGDLAAVKIGIVTGANRIFVIDDLTAKEEKIPDSALKGVFAKFATAPGIRIRFCDLLAARHRGMRTLFVDGSKVAECRPVRRYFAAVPAAFRKSNATFAKYLDWRCPDDGRIPDAFFPYMHHTGPRLVMNECSVNSTNTIHRVYFKPEIPALRRKLAALSLLSSFSQLSAEIQGRSYGAGVLKHEPTEVSRIELIMPIDLSEAVINELFDHVNVLLTDGLVSRATQIVDERLSDGMKHAPSRKDWDSIRAALRRIRTRRQGG